MKIYHCWRCRKDLPFLEENEWQQVSALLPKQAERIKTYRKKHQCSLQEARLHCLDEASQKFEELTGVAGLAWEAIYHHRLADYGPECPTCAKLLRTKTARKCMYCDWREPV